MSPCTDPHDAAIPPSRRHAAVTAARASSQKHTATRTGACTAVQRRPVRCYYYRYLGCTTDCCCCCTAPCHHCHLLFCLGSTTRLFYRYPHNRRYRTGGSTAVRRWYRVAQILPLTDRGTTAHLLSARASCRGGGRALHWNFAQSSNASKFQNPEGGGQARTQLNTWPRRLAQVPDTGRRRAVCERREWRCHFVLAPTVYLFACATAHPLSLPASYVSDDRAPTQLTHSLHRPTHTSGDGGG